ncbi:MULTISPECIES: SRPBCC family protein [Ferrimicrobium]|uniref:SRPBCC family protein n=1 Tax=Ferrimicrobium TaxID=121038 RepID=UPI0023F55BFF|nr:MULTISPECIES: SRPBCC family protein [Ferrimicrobium]
MSEITRASVTSKAQPSAIFARWVDHATWSEWDPATEWVHLMGPVATGTHGVMKSKGAPKIKFVISACVTDREYADTTKLFGATLVFAHWVRPDEEGGGSRLDVAVTIDGPLAFAWTRILGPGFKRSVGPSLNRLVALVESP